MIGVFCTKNGEIDFLVTLKNSFNQTVKKSKWMSLFAVGYSFVSLFLIYNSFKKRIAMCSIYVYGYFAFMYVCVMYVQYLLRPEEGIGSSESGITDGCELSCGC